MEMFYARMGLTQPIRSSKGVSDHGTHREGLKRVRCWRGNHQRLRGNSTNDKAGAEQWRSKKLKNKQNRRQAETIEI